MRASSRLTALAFVVTVTSIIMDMGASSVASACWHEDHCAPANHYWRHRIVNWTFSFAGSSLDMPSSDLPAAPTPPPPPPGFAFAPAPAGTAVDRVSVTSFTTRMLFHKGLWYGGTEIGFGFGAAPKDRDATVVLAQNGLVVGLAAPLGRVTLSAEMFAGWRLVGVTDAAGGAGWVAGPRAGAALWLTSHMALGAYVGEDLVHPGEHSIGLSLAGSFVPFGGSGR